MELKIEPGTYVVAVSGGVDSMALLDMLVKDPELKIIVAHYDHGIREDSHLDRQLVQDVAQRQGLTFVYDEGKLGQEVSEDQARDARYKFLKRVLKNSNAKAIITAHHQDDLLETATHNILRGSGWRGLVSLKSRGKLLRPLLVVPKEDLIAYAKDQGLVWREDSTNRDLKYRRNYIRHKIMPKLSGEQKLELLQHIRKIQSLENDIEIELINHLHLHPGVSELDRHWFVMLPHDVSLEVKLVWLRKHKIKELNRKQLHQLVRAAKTNTPGTRIDIDKEYVLNIQKELLVITKRENTKKQKSRK